MRKESANNKPSVTYYVWKECAKCAKISVVSTTTNRKLANATDVHTIIRHSQPPNHTAMGGVVISCQSK